MKKTVSINIGGIIFHIEEDGFEKLKSYLDSVNKYFSTFEDSKEIISDIEGRIAEIFLSKLTASRQTINIEDVDELITTMGTTQDFDATLEAEPEIQKDPPKAEKASSKREKGRTTKRLYRDTKRRIIGGVSAGIAHYFGIDPLWIRLLFIALFAGVVFTGIGWFTILAYVILWIVLPFSNELEDDTHVKKLFRNPDERVLGGVSGGIAAYFGIDVSVVRLIFVLSIFLGGAGLLIYIILWIITPLAKTITEKVQMEGEPVTLKTIEDTVKKNLRVKEGEEGPLVKILLFPFRLIALIINGVAKVLGPLMRFLVDAIRIIFGAIISINGFLFMVAFTGVLLTIYGIGGMSNLYNLGEIPIELIRYSLDPVVIFSVWGFGLITALGFFLIGLSIILKKRVVNSYVGWSLFALWLISMALISYSVPAYITEFRSDSSYKSEKIFELVKDEIPMLKLSGDPSYGPNLVDLRLRGTTDSVYRLVLDIESRGSDRTSAQENAKKVEYNVEKSGNEFLFDPKPVFPEGTKFRFQHIDATFYVPEGQVFRMEEDLDRILTNTLYGSGYRSYQMDGNDWMFDEDGIKCVTCPVDESTLSDEDDAHYGDMMSYPFEDFDEVKVASLIDVDIRAGSEYKVTLYGDDLDEVYLNQVGDELEVKYKEDAWELWDDRDREIKLNITMPELNYLELVGKCKGDVRGFNSGDLRINLIGASELSLDARLRNLEITLAGASEMILDGSGEVLDVEVIGGSKLRAFDFKVDRAMLEVIGASRAEVYVVEDLEIEAVGMSKVRYRGDAKVSVEEAGMSSVERD
ncbi:MAG: PspC domain-containing protein [Bacteroidota bacterium]